MMVTTNPRPNPESNQATTSNTAEQSFVGPEPSVAEAPGDEEHGLTFEPAVRRQLDILVKLFNVWPDRVPPEWWPDGEDPDGPEKYGPLTRWVKANGGLFARGSAERFNRFGFLVMLLDASLDDLDILLMGIARHAKKSGRADQVNSLWKPAEKLVDAWCEKAESQPRWQRAKRRLAQRVGVSPDADHGPFEKQLRNLLLQGVFAHLATCALWDVLPEHFLERGVCPWVFAQFDPIWTPSALMPLDWTAPTGVQMQISDLVRGATVLQLATLVRRYADRIVQSKEFARLRVMLLGYAITGGAAFDCLECVLDQMDKDGLEFIQGIDDDCRSDQDPADEGPQDRDDDRTPPESSEEESSKEESCGGDSVPDPHAVLDSFRLMLLEALTVLSAAICFSDILEQDEMHLLVDSFEQLLPGAGALIERGVG